MCTRKMAHAYMYAVRSCILREKRRQGPVPSSVLAEATKRRAELLERLADVDDHLAELLLSERPFPEKEVTDAIRRATLDLKFSPVMMVQRCTQTRVCVCVCVHREGR
jgi:translation elongation factor EF-G